MIDRQLAERYCERLIASNGDGTYSLAPWGRFGRVYLVSEEQKRQYVDWQVNYNRLMFGLLILALLAKPLDNWPSPLSISVVSLFCVGLICAFAMPLYLLRGRPTTAYSDAVALQARYREFKRASYWDRFLPYSMGVLYAYLVLAGFFAAAGVFVVLMALARQEPLPDPEVWILCAFFGVATWGTWKLIRHRRAQSNRARQS